MSEAGSRMRIGITLPMSMSDGPGRMPAWDDVCGLARYAESAGLDSVWICDHLVSEPVGTLVTCVSLRRPALLAKMAATVDGISGGRLVLGLGAGFPGLEYEWWKAWDSLGFARHRMGHHGQAETAYREALQELRAAGDQPHEEA